MNTRKLEHLGRSNRFVGPFDKFIFITRSFSNLSELFQYNSNFLQRFRIMQSLQHKQSIVNSNKPLLVLCERKMVPIKRRFNNKPIGVKSKALKDLEKGMASKDMAEKYCVSKNTASSWVKNKYKLTTFLEWKGMSSSVVCWKMRPKSFNRWGHT